MFCCCLEKVLHYLRIDVGKNASLYVYKHCHNVALMLHIQLKDCIPNLCIKVEKSSINSVAQLINSVKNYFMTIATYHVIKVSEATCNVAWAYALICDRYGDKNHVISAISEIF